MNYFMKNYDEKLIKIINLILNDFENFDKAFFNDHGDIIIKNKTIKETQRKNYILTNVFKQIIANDIKKNRV